MNLILDAGAFIGIERSSSSVRGYLERAAASGWELRTHGGIVAQVWRDGARQTRVAKALQAVTVVALDESLGRRAGLLMAHSGTSDAIDAALVALARRGDTLLTSDPTDLRNLAEAAELPVTIIDV